MRIIATVFDSRELSGKTRRFLEDNGWLSEFDGFFWLSETEIIDSLYDDGSPELFAIPDSWWSDAALIGEQRKVLEELWRKDPNIEARWGAE